MNNANPPPGGDAHDGCVDVEEGAAAVEEPQRWMIRALFGAGGDRASLEAELRLTTGGRGPS